MDRLQAGHAVDRGLRLRRTGDVEPVGDRPVAGELGDREGDGPLFQGVADGEGDVEGGVPRRKEREGLVAPGECDLDRTVASGKGISLVAAGTEDGPIDGDALGKD